MQPTALSADTGTSFTQIHEWTNFVDQPAVASAPSAGFSPTNRGVSKDISDNGLFDRAFTNVFRDEALGSAS
jgi:hypothetical protein